MGIIFRSLIAKLSNELSLSIVILMLVIGCGGGSGNGGPSDQNPDNQLPIITVTYDNVAMAGSQIEVTCSAEDSDGTIASYLWEQISGPSLELEGSHTQTVSFTCPDVEEDTIIEIALTVTDDLGGTATETITITITNSPDGIVQAEKVFFEQIDKLYVIDADGQNLKEFIPDRPMVRDISNRSISPDGKSLVYLSRAPDFSDTPNLKLSKISLITLQTETLFDFDNGCENFSEIKWASDSKHLGFMSACGLPNSESIIILNKKNEFDPFIYQVPSEAHSYNFFWSPSGNYFSTIETFYDREGGPEEIVIFSKSGQEISRIQNAYQPDVMLNYWSPIEDRLVYTKNRASNPYYHDIHIASYDGSNDFVIAENYYSAYKTYWSPDGQKILFSDDQELYYSDLTGNTPHLINDEIYGDYFGWSSDSQKIWYFSRDGQINYYVFDITTSETYSFTGVSLNNIVWSPSGQYIAFGTAKYVPDEESLNVITFDGSSIIEIAQGNYNPSREKMFEWSNDSQFLVFKRHGSEYGHSELAIYHVSSNNIETVPGYMSEYNTVEEFSLTPDSRQIVFLTKGLYPGTETKSSFLYSYPTNGNGGLIKLNEGAETIEMTDSDQNIINYGNVGFFMMRNHQWSWANYLDPYTNTTGLSQSRHPAF